MTETTVHAWPAAAGEVAPDAAPVVDLSVVVPAYNEAASLPELVAAIAEALAGSGSSYDVWIVDDGSDDGTFAVIERLAGFKECVEFVHGQQLRSSILIEDRIGGCVEDPPLELVQRTHDERQQVDDVRVDDDLVVVEALLTRKLAGIFLVIRHAFASFVFLLVSDCIG